MALNPALLAEDPEIALHLLQRQRKQRITLAVIGVSSAVVAAILAMTIAYSGDPGAAQNAAAQNLPAQGAP